MGPRARTLPERRLSQLGDESSADIGRVMSICQARGFPADTGLVVHLPDGRRLVGADTLEGVLDVAGQYAPVNAAQRPSGPGRWALVVASRAVWGWVEVGP